MKKILSLLTVTPLIAMLLGGCSNREINPNELTNKPKGKVLVVYYSQSNLKNTGTLANWIAQATNGDIYEIEPLIPYPDNYKQVVKQSKEEIDNNFHPKLKPASHSPADYEIIFIGSPIWHGTYAPPVGTFLAENDLSGKTIIPFCTHGGGGAGRFYSDINQNTASAKVVSNGFTAKGSNIVERTLGYGTKNKVSQDELIEWLNIVFQ